MHFVFAITTTTHTTTTYRFREGALKPLALLPLSLLILSLVAGLVIVLPSSAPAHAIGPNSGGWTSTTVYGGRNYQFRVLSHLLRLHLLCRGSRSWRCFICCLLRPRDFNRSDLMDIDHCLRRWHGRFRVLRHFWGLHLLRWGGRSGLCIFRRLLCPCLINGRRHVDFDYGLWRRGSPKRVLRYLFRLHLLRWE